MSEKEYMDADIEVISMVNKGHGPGGELQRKVMHFIPEKDAPAVLEIDRRIQQIHKWRGAFILAAIVIAFLLGVRA